MARIEWVVVCDHAFFDRHDRLCTVGIATTLSVVALPVCVRQLMVVARLSAPRPGEEIGVGVVVVTPSGMWAMPEEPDSVHIEVAKEYVLVTIRDLPLFEAGPYRFEVRLDEQTVAAEVPVRIKPTHRYAEVH